VQINAYYTQTDYSDVSGDVDSSAQGLSRSLGFGLDGDYDVYRFSTDYRLLSNERQDSHHLNAYLLYRKRMRGSSFQFRASNAYSYLDNKDKLSSYDNKQTNVSGVLVKYDTRWRHGIYFRGQSHYRLALSSRGDTEQEFVISGQCKFKVNKVFFNAGLEEKFWKRGTTLSRTESVFLRMNRHF
jgi:hypothetical protein